MASTTAQERSSEGRDGPKALPITPEELDEFVERGSDPFWKSLLAAVQDGEYVLRADD